MEVPVLSDQRISDEVGRKKLTGLCAAVYFTSYLTRLDYSCVMVAMIASTGFSKESLSLALTALFITYGIGQLISGWLGDRLPPKYIMFGGLILSSVMNLLIPVCVSASQMTLVWGVNGFAQAMMWPPLVRILTERLTTDQYKRASVRVSWASSLATMLLYLISPVIITFSGWRTVFWLCSLFAVTVSVCWLLGYNRIEARYGRITHRRPVGDQMQETEMKIPWGMLAPLLIPVAAAIICQGLIRDGATTWMPTFVSETFSWGSASAILTGVALPVFSIICFEIVLFLNRKLIRNELLLAAVMFCGGIGSFALMQTVGMTQPLLCVICFTVAVGCMHGVNQILICMLPAFFAKFGKVSFFSGILNACTYIGSAASAYGVALITENAGWNMTLVLWFAVCILGAVLCFTCVSGWKKYKNTLE